MHFGLAIIEYGDDSNKREFRNVALIREETLISMWIPKSAALIRGQRLLEV